MKKQILFTLTILIGFPLLLSAQNDTSSVNLSDKEAKKLMKEVMKQNDFHARFLRDAANNACTCLDSIGTINKSQKQISQDISSCIDKEVGTYQAALQILESLIGSSKNKNIIMIADDKNSVQYQKYYREIEERLMDSCKILKILASSENKETKYSNSENEEAQKQYQIGEKLSTKGKFADAIPFYEKAVEMDPKFAFAWDNLGYCYRNTKQLDKAIEAYKKSIAINPCGEMPLQNIAVAYEFKNETDKAIAAYKDLLEKYPDAVEGYYGIGRQLYLYKEDYESALDYFCKAYNLYVKMNSPYRADAQKMINSIYAKMKGKKSEKKFIEILKNNNIEINKKD